MRSIFIVLTAAVLAACGSSTGPSKAGDPSLLITNNLDSSWVYVTWQDGAAIVGKDSVAPKTASQCVRFTAQPDSAYWHIDASDNGHLSTQTAPYFNPASRPAWRVIVSPAPASPVILTTLVNTAC